MIDLTAALVADTDAIARRLVAAVSAHLVGARAGDGPDDEQLRELAAVVRRLRPVAGIALQAQLARSMQRAVREEFGEVLAKVASETPAAPAG